MAKYLDSVPMSGIIRIRDMMYEVERPFRLDQGDVSFDAPDTVKDGMRLAVDENRSHYLQTTGVPRLLTLLVEKLRRKNGIPVGGTDEVMVTNGGIHALYLLWQALLEPGDEVLVPDPEWPPAEGTILAARGVVVRYPLHEAGRWRPDIAELARLVTPRTRAIYLNSPNNPTGGVLTADDLARVADLARERNLLVVSDEAYEDVVFEGDHVSIASLPGMYERTVSVFTFSKSYAMTGLRLGYLALGDERLRDRLRKVLFFTTSNVSSVVQYRRHRRARGIAGGHRPVQDRAGAQARSLLRGARAPGRRAHRAAAGRRLLCLREDRQRLEAAGDAPDRFAGRDGNQGRLRIAVVGADRLSHSQRARRLRARRRLRAVG